MLISMFVSPKNTVKQLHSKKCITCICQVITTAISIEKNNCVNSLPHVRVLRALPFLYGMTYWGAANGRVAHTVVIRAAGMLAVVTYNGSRGMRY